MAYADDLRTGSPTFEIVASLIEGIFSSLFSLVFSTWTPSYTANGSMTYTSVSTTFAYYIRCGEWCMGFLLASGTVGGTPARILAHSLPFTPASSNQGGAAAYVVDGGNQIGGCGIIGSSLSVTRYDAGNWSAGAGRVIATLFCFRVA